MKTQAPSPRIDNFIPATRSRVDIHPVTFSQAAADVVLHVDCRIRNIGPASLESVAPKPVHVSYKWFDAKNDTQLGGEGLRTALVSPVLAGGAVQQKVQIRTPSRPGRYVLRITLVQEHVGWFDDVDPQNGADQTVDIK